MWLQRKEKESRRIRLQRKEKASGRAARKARTGREARAKEKATKEKPLGRAKGPSVASQKARGPAGPERRTKERVGRLNPDGSKEAGTGTVVGKP